MREVMELRTNIWHEAALKFPTGKPIGTKYGPKVLFTVINSEGQERVLFLTAEEAAKVEGLGLRPLEPVSLGKVEVKNGNARHVEFQIERANPPEPPAPSAPVKVNGAADPGAGSDPSHNHSTPVPINGKVNGHAAANGMPYWDSKAELLRCYEGAIEVLVLAREHAAAKGLPVQFTGEDLRQVAATLYIDAGRDRRTPWGR